MHFPKSIRLQPEAYANPDNVFHIVVRTHPEVGMLCDAVRDAVWAAVVEQAKGERVVLIAACLMPDHLHLLLRPGRLDIVTFLDRWKSWTTRLAWGAGHRGPLWQPSFWDRSIRQDDFDGVLQYILLNPVEAGLVKAWDEWCHSWTAV